MLIYKLLRHDEWAGFEAAGETVGAPVDRTDGFIHFSTRDTLAGTLAKHFAGETGLVLVAVEAARLGPALRWEVSRGGALFPHLYRRLHRADMAWARPLADGPDGAILPDDLP